MRTYEFNDGFRGFFTVQVARYVESQAGRWLERRTVLHFSAALTNNNSLIDYFEYNFVAIVSTRVLTPFQSRTKGSHEGIYSITQTIHYFA